MQRKFWLDLCRHPLSVAGEVYRDGTISCSILRLTSPAEPGSPGGGLAIFDFNQDGIITNFAPVKFPKSPHRQLFYNPANEKVLSHLSLGKWPLALFASGC